MRTTRDGPSPSLIVESGWTDVIEDGSKGSTSLERGDLLRCVSTVYLGGFRRETYEERYVSGRH